MFSMQSNLKTPRIISTILLNSLQLNLKKLLIAWPWLNYKYIHTRSRRLRQVPRLIELSLIQTHTD